MEDDQKFLKARPTIYKGIQMRSRLEAGFAAWLDRFPEWTWEYEPCAFANEDGQYLPDFRVEGMYDASMCVTRRAYVEVKPTAPPKQGIVAQQLGIIAACETPRPMLVCAWPGGMARISTDGWLCPAELCQRVVDGEPCAPGLACPTDNRPWPDGYWQVQ